MVTMRDKAGVGRMSGDAGALSVCEVRHRSHHRPGVHIWIGSSRNWSVFVERPQRGTPQDGCDSLSMQPVGRTPRTQPLFVFYLL